MGKLIEEFERAAGALTVTEQDQAAVALGRRYAEAIDADPSLLVKLGPMLLAVLDALAMTPRGRAAQTAKGGRRDNGPADTGLTHDDDCPCLPCQRSRHASRVYRPAAVDAPPS